MLSKLLATTSYPGRGYEVRTEELRYDSESRPIVMDSAYTVPGGHYIGTPDDAENLCVAMGIHPELIDSEHRVCSIGFCESDQKWFGWSHRAIHGFGVGSTVKKGDCGYVPSDVHELDIGYAESDETIEVPCPATHTAKNFFIAGSFSIGDANTLDSSNREVFGRGEWTAKTLDDAKQMAIDFANGVA